MMWESIQPYVQDFLVTVLTGILAATSAFLIALAKKGFDWLSAKIESIRDQNSRDNLQQAIDNLENVVTTTVSALNQTLGDDIRESIEAGDGKYTSEDLHKLKDAALETIKAQLSESTKELLRTVYPLLDDYISDLIEATVKQLKS